MKNSTIRKIALATLLTSFALNSNAQDISLNAQELVEKEQKSFMEQREALQSVFSNFREKYPELVTKVSEKERLKRDALHERREARINQIQHIKPTNWALSKNKILDKMIVKKDKNNFEIFTLSKLEF